MKKKIFLKFWSSLIFYLDFDPHLNWEHFVRYFRPGSSPTMSALLSLFYKCCTVAICPLTHLLVFKFRITKYLVANWFVNKDSNVNQILKAGLHIFIKVLSANNWNIFKLDYSKQYRNTQKNNVQFQVLQCWGESVEWSENNSLDFFHYKLFLSRLGIYSS